MKIKPWALLVSIGIPLLAGGLSALLSGGGMAAFSMLHKPPLSPPGWLFPIVWTILYVLMGIASYLVYMSDAGEQEVSRALITYGFQLFFNFFWSILFFRFSWYFFSFIWLAVLWVLILLTIRLFAAIDKRAAYLLIPYLIWVTFAGYLNLGIALLN